MNLSALDLNLLLVLHAVLEERSATRAAKRLNVTQSAVSNALGRLRSALGDPLVVRDGRGLVATPRAAELAPLLAQGIAQIEAAIKGSQSFLPLESKRRFTIAAADNHQASEAPRVAALFSKRLPHASLRTVSVDFLTASDGLTTGEVDLAIVPGALVERGHLSSHLFDEDACLVVRRDHPQVRGRLTPKALSKLAHIDTEVVLGKRGAGHLAAERQWKRVGLERRVAITVPYFMIAAMMASQTDFVAGLPSRAAKVLCKVLPIKIVPTTFALPAIGISMMWHVRTEGDPGSTYLRELVRQAIGDA